MRWWPATMHVIVCASVCFSNWVSTIFMRLWSRGPYFMWVWVKVKPCMAICWSNGIKSAHRFEIERIVAADVYVCAWSIVNWLCHGWMLCVTPVRLLNKGDINGLFVQEIEMQPQPFIANSSALYSTTLRYTLSRSSEPKMHKMVSTELAFFWCVCVSFFGGFTIYRFVYIFTTFFGLWQKYSW